ncbi:ubiquitin-specific protease UBP14 NDAI_0A07410 [Naumovozyma dairenensis CBS 421]|uniref:Ubiquitin carboxyl-terminal hydrolase n=1 Tax=Naumovozyma dairenensis (strain ATCC 10597 / BCRC 20456 / CBS 421 / NBRC 0211 / NRRL Y-12639) TaxID=1071378 RepID=G0W507_NAUDC|nr:hypothetical protein NDAI_0A07410 [Naumovozyma dairenensis CBS 421]CCD22895.1 hypothetical protein NDAI_0A07410 [Naumovozyma dairenensis CBS 421]
MSFEEIFKSLSVPTVIAKDECIYCFESLYNNNPEKETRHSLNICLSCFQAVCKKHTGLHHKVTEQNCEFSHKHYLNLAKISREENDSKNSITGPSQEKNKKIKLQIVDKSEDELYDTNWSTVEVKVLGDGSLSQDTINKGTFRDGKLSPIEGDNINEKIPQIINAKSKVLVDEKQAWELQMKSCQHTHNLEATASTISIPESSLNLEKCHDCDLPSNLWLCLHCGNVGCGRNQVGIDGHSHALAHFNTNKEHSLAIKLGSLSTLSNDLYCYSCDDEVKFGTPEFLSNYLSKNFKININSNAFGNEKSLIELQIEQNMNWDFKMVDAQGRSLLRLSPSKGLGCGLINLGNSCYLNSVMQCLLNGGVPNWSDKLGNIIGHDFPKDVIYPTGNLRCQMIKLLNAFKLNPEDYEEGIRPRSFKECVGKHNAEFKTNNQQDSMEFLTFVTEELEKGLFPKIQDASINPNNLLKFIMEDKLQCVECKNVKYTYQPNECIQLPLKEGNDLVGTTTQNLMELITDYFQGEEIEFSCPTCKRMTKAVKKQSFKTFPNTLIINPLRIKLDKWVPVKTSDSLVIPDLDDANCEFLDIANFQSKGFDAEIEILFPETDQGTQFVPDENSMAQLQEMGFTPNAIKRSLYETGNKDTEVAMNWLFQHIDDPDLNSEFVAPSTSKSKTAEVDQSSLQTMLAMGLDAKLSRKALTIYSGDVAASTEWVFNNLDDDGELESVHEEVEERTEGGSEPGNLDNKPYKLTAVICHKGTSVHSGHYVAFIRKLIDNERKWVLYNDEKIVISENMDEIKRNGYIYIYSRDNL